MRRVMRRVTIRAMRGAMKSTMRIAVRGAMKQGAVWAGVSQASFAAGARDTHRFNPATTTLALQVGQTPIQDEQSRTVSMLEAAQLRGKVLPFIVGVVTVDLALASFYWGVYVPYYAEQEAPQ